MRPPLHAVRVGTEDEQGADGVVMPAAPGGISVEVQREAQRLLSAAIALLGVPVDSGAPAAPEMSTAARVPGVDRPDLVALDASMDLATCRIPYQGGYRLRGRWMSDDYTRLRNAAWAVRNSRQGKDFNPLALRLVLFEAIRLMAKGEPLVDILEAFAELLTRP